MDHLDFQALQLLVRQGRITWAELAPQLGLSPPAAAERVRRLEEKGMIKGYAAVLDREALGYNLTAFVGADLSHQRHRAEFLALVASRPEILECHHVAGDHDYILKICCRNARALDRFINDVLKQGEAVARTRSIIVLSTVKEELFVPTEAGSDPGAAGG